MCSFICHFSHSKHTTHYKKSKNTLQLGLQSGQRSFLLCERTNIYFSVSCVSIEANPVGGLKQLPQSESFPFGVSLDKNGVFSIATDGKCIALFWN